MTVKNLMDIISRLPQDVKIEAVFKTSYGHQEKADITGVDVQFLPTGTTRITIKVEEVKAEDCSFSDEERAA